RAGLGAASSGARTHGAEPVADLEAGSARSPRPFEVGGAEVAGLIDELPVLAVAATQLPGVTRVTGAGELRVKESDRIGAMAAALSVLELHELEVEGPRADFDQEIAAAEAEARAGRVGDTIRARMLYRSFGEDPTRHRPASEALLRRVRRGEGLPRVNSLVDV